MNSGFQPASKALEGIGFGHPSVIRYLIEKGYLGEPYTEEDYRAAFGKFHSELEAERESQIVCKACRDIKFVYPTTPRGKPDYSRMVACPVCSKVTNTESIHRRLTQTGIPERHFGKTFSSWRHAPGAEDAVNAVFELAAGDAHYHLLLLYGRTGNGKTHLGYAAIIHVRGERSMEASWVSLSDFFADLRREIGDKEGPREVVMDGLKETPFLVLDDMAAEYDTPWQIARLEELIDYRYREGLPTIFITNRDIEPQVDGMGKTIEPLPEQILRRFREVGTGLTVQNEAEEYPGDIIQ